jgi:RNA polymerase sigma-70 factor (ECF subfamily)
MDAEDIFSKAFNKAYRKSDSFRGDSSIKTWLYRIVHNAFLDFNRKPSNRLEKPVSYFSTEEGEDSDSFLDFAMRVHKNEQDNPSIVSEKNDENENLRKKINISKKKLTETHRKIVEAIFEQGCSYHDAAKKMNCSIGTIMSRVFYARKNFIKAFNSISDDQVYAKVRDSFCDSNSCQQYS